MTFTSTDPMAHHDIRVMSEEDYQAANKQDEPNESKPSESDNPVEGLLALLKDQRL